MPTKNEVSAIKTLVKISKAITGNKHGRSSNTTNATVPPALRPVVNAIARTARASASSYYPRKRRRRRNGKKKGKPFTKRQYNAVQRLTRKTYIPRMHMNEQSAQLDIPVNQADYAALLIADRQEARKMFTEYVVVNEAGAAGSVDIADDYENASIKMYNFYSELFIRNNSDLATWVVVYKGYTKECTDTNPITMMEAGLDVANLSAAGTLETNVQTNPTDSKRFNKHFKLYGKQMFKLAGGDSIRLTWFQKFRLTIGQRDLQSTLDDYQKNLLHFWLVKGFGDVGHAAASTSTVGLSDGVLDIVELHKIKFGVTDYQTPEVQRVTSSLSTVTDPVQYAANLEEATGDL